MSDRADRLAAWVGWPIWGVVVAGIFLSYTALAADLFQLPSRAVDWLWVAWVALGIVTTNLVARRLGASTFDVTSRSDWASALAGIGVFLVVQGVVRLAPSPAGPSAANLLYTGAIAAALAVLQRFRVGIAVWPGLVVGAGLIGLAYTLPELSGTETVRGIGAALATVLGFGAVGVVGRAVDSG